MKNGNDLRQLQELDTKKSIFFWIEELESYMYLLVIAGGRTSHKF